MIISAKWCPRCGRLLPVSAFTPDKSKAEGVKSWCRSCDAERAREYYRAGGGREVKAAYYQRRQGTTPAP